MQIFTQNKHLTVAHPSSQWVKITTQKGVVRSRRRPTPTSLRVVQQSQLPINATWMQSFFNAYLTYLSTSTERVFVDRKNCMLSAAVVYIYMHHQKKLNEISIQKCTYHQPPGVPTLYMEYSFIRITIKNLNFHHSLPKKNWVVKNWSTSFIEKIKWTKTCWSR